MDFAGLRTFLAVAAERSFSRAATKLYRSQPAVSLAIQRLEEELGEVLFDRSSRGNELTPAGAVLQDYAARVLRLVEETTMAVRGAGRVSPPPTVTIGADAQMVNALGPLVEAFRDAHPDLHVELRVAAPPVSCQQRRVRASMSARSRRAAVVDVRRIAREVP
jgi:DNA-binding transcriptional LysR family regulator